MKNWKKKKTHKELLNALKAILDNGNKRSLEQLMYLERYSNLASLPSCFPVMDRKLEEWCFHLSLLLHLSLLGIPPPVTNIQLSALA